jgi:hypothetical protein
MANTDTAGGGSAILPTAALSGGALLVSGSSYYVLNNQIIELTDNLKKSDLNLIKIIRLVSSHNDSILKIEDIEEAATKNSVLVKQLMDTNQELLQRLRQVELNSDENYSHLQHIENYLLLDNKYQPYYNNISNRYNESKNRNYYDDYESQYNGYGSKMSESRPYESRSFESKSFGSSPFENKSFESSGGIDSDEDEDEEELIRRMRAMRK